MAENLCPAVCPGSVRGQLPDKRRTVAGKKCPASCPAGKTGVNIIANIPGKIPPPAYRETGNRTKDRTNPPFHLPIRPDSLRRLASSSVGLVRMTEGKTTGQKTGQTNERTAPGQIFLRSRKRLMSWRPLLTVFAGAILFRTHLIPGEVLERRRPRSARPRLRSFLTPFPDQQGPILQQRPKLTEYGPAKVRRHAGERACPRCLDSSANPLLSLGLVPLMVFRLALLLPNSPKRLFEKPGGLFAVSALEPHSVDLNLTNW